MMRLLTLVRSRICTGAALLVMQGSMLAQSSNGVHRSQNTLEVRGSSGAQSIPGGAPLVVQGPANQGPAALSRCIPDGCPPPTFTNEAVMRSTGDFEVFDSTSTMIFSTGTAGTGASIIRVQDDGNLVIYAFVWQAGTYAAPSPGPFPPASCKIATLLHAPQMMFGGQCIVSPSGQYFFYLDPSGILFIYDQAHNVGTWGVQGTAGSFLNFQPDGNLVLYDATGTTAEWNSVTSNTGADLLNMENDGRIILYRPVWNTQTSRGWDTNTYPHPSCDVGPGTGLTGAIGIGQCFVSPNGRYELLLQSNDHLVLLDLSVYPPLTLWGS